MSDSDATPASRESLVPDEGPAAEAREDPVCWRGLGFAIDELRLGATFDEVSAVVASGAITPVPRTRPWLRGITNVRGTIYSVVDLSLYFGRALIASEVKPKLLVASDANLQVALLVPQVLGLRQFCASDEVHGLSDIDGEVQPYITRRFAHRDEDWIVLEVSKLIQDRTFRYIAVDS